ncbi:hypothetical protein QBC34DRAFT_480008, partial [Podospora aff. communis PSN243]
QYFSATRLLPLPLHSHATATSRWTTDNPTSKSHKLSTRNLTIVSEIHGPVIGIPVGHHLEPLPWLNLRGEYPAVRQRPPTVAIHELAIIESFGRLIRAAYRAIGSVVPSEQRPGLVHGTRHRHKRSGTSAGHLGWRRRPDPLIENGALKGPLNEDLASVVHGVGRVAGQRAAGEVEVEQRDTVGRVCRRPDPPLLFVCVVGTVPDLGRDQAESVRVPAVCAGHVAPRDDLETKPSNHGRLGGRCAGGAGARGDD